MFSLTKRRAYAIAATVIPFHKNLDTNTDLYERPDRVSTRFICIAINVKWYYCSDYYPEHSFI